jgi:ssDNA-binding Zn-finger/Zn-ribbon topoisomerase 1
MLLRGIGEEMSEGKSDCRNCKHSFDAFKPFNLVGCSGIPADTVRLLTSEQKEIIEAGLCPWFEPREVEMKEEENKPHAGTGHRCIECQKTRYEKKGSFIYCPATGVIRLGVLVNGVIRLGMLNLSDEACEMFTPFRSGGEEPDGQSRTEWI